MTIAVTGATTAAPQAASEGRRAELAKAAQAFEAVFMRQMIGSMRQASFGDDLFGSSSADQFRDMQDARVADSMAQKGGLGIAEMLLKQFDAAAAIAAPAPAPTAGKAAR